MLSAKYKTELAADLRANTLVNTVYPDDMLARLDRVNCTEMFVPTRAGDTRCLFVTRPDLPEGAPLFINLHGGGFVRGHQRRDTMFCALLAEETGCGVLDIDYRLSPEHPFPTALHETYDVLQWAFANAAKLRIDRARIAIGGHSAGGNLAAAACLMAVQEGGELPCLQILDYPFLDAVTEPEDKIGDGPSIFTPQRLRAFNDLHVPETRDRHNPLVSPVLAANEDLARVPPALILIAGLDPLRHEAARFAVRLGAVGVPVTVDRFERSDHGFLIANLAEYQRGRERIVQTLLDVFEKS